MVDQFASQLNTGLPLKINAWFVNVVAKALFVITGRREWRTTISNACALGEVPNKALIATLREASARAGGRVEEGSFFTETVVRAGYASAALFTPDCSARALVEIFNVSLSIVGELQRDARALANTLVLVPDVVLRARLDEAGAFALV